MADYPSSPETGGSASSAQEPAWKDKQHDVESEAKDTAKRASSLASDVTARKIDEHKSEFRTTIENIADGLEKGQEELDRSQLKDLTLSAAEQLRRFASNLDTTDGQSMMRRLSQESRRRPVTSGIAGALAGFAMGRALRATPQTADSYDRNPDGNSNQFGSTGSAAGTGSTSGATGTTGYSADRPDPASRMGSHDPADKTASTANLTPTEDSAASAAFADSKVQSETADTSATSKTSKPKTSGTASTGSTKKTD
jgi:hypothetical protein